MKSAAILLAALLAATALVAHATQLPRTDATVKQLEDTYRRYLKAARAADMEGFRAVMSQPAREKLARLNPEALPGLSRDDIEPTAEAFGRADVTATHARLIYSKAFADHVRWQGILFVKEADGWRIDKLVAALDPREMTPEARKQAGRLGLEGVLGHPLMQLPAR